MRRVVRKLRVLKTRRRADRLIGPNKYLDMIPGENLTDKICVTDLNDLFLNSMPNIWSNHAYVQVFDFESITLKTSVNMLEGMVISESIYVGVVET